MRVTEAAVAFGRKALGGSHAATEPGRLLVDAMPTGVGGHEHAAMVQLHEAVLANHGDVLAGEPHPGAIVLWRN